MSPSLITTHVLDTAVGGPAAGVRVRLELVGDDGSTVLAEATTDDDGRVRQLGPTELVPATYRLVFATGAYHESSGTSTFFPEVVITFTVEDGTAHYHVPLLLSPFAYSTYRGS